jgi:hypothetical protein
VRSLRAQLAEAVDEVGADLVNAHNWRAGVIGFLASRGVALLVNRS